MIPFQFFLQAKAIPQLALLPQTQALQVRVLEREARASISSFEVQQVCENEPQ